MTEPTALGGRYEIGEVLGRGGMAEVHVGLDTRLGRRVAVKMLRVDLARDPSFQVRFRREAQSAAALNHPSIVAVYDTGEDTVNRSSVPYIVMEYVDGSTLRDLVNSGRRLLPERALEITAGVLEALDYSHRHGIVHRDIKPANVMLTRTGDVKVMDFGIARAVADTSATMTQTSAVIGTAQYLSPEQARGETVDARSDLYSTGCLLYELLTGRPPFIGDSPVSVAYQHVREQPQPPSTLDPDVPAEADAIALKALVKDKRQRYQSAGQMRADIERALAGRPVEAPAIAPATQRMEPITATPAPAALPPPTVRPRPRRGAGAIVMLLLAALIVFLLSLLAGRELWSQAAGGQVVVPRVEGLQESAARAAILEAKLRPGNRSEEFSAQDTGIVIRQSPVASTSVRSGTDVDLVVSRGQELATVPTLVGLRGDEAVTALQDANLKRGRVTRRDSSEPAGQVLDAEPKEGREVPVGTAVNLIVASGSAEIPDVRGRSAGEARSVLQSAGFGVEVRRREEAGTPGTVIDQSPDPGESRPAGTTVRITVVAERPSPTPRATPTQTPTRSPTPSPTPEQSPSPEPATPTGQP